MDLWNGNLMKELLERSDLDSKMNLDPPMKAKVEVESISPESAYLGPKLWEKPLSFNEEDYFVMNIDDFLAENELPKDKFGGALKTSEGSPPPEDMKCTSFSKLSYRSPDSPPSPFGMEMSPPHSISIPSPGSEGEYSAPASVSSPRPGVIVSAAKRNFLPKGENSFLYAESKRAKIEREKEEKKRKLEIDFEFAPEDLALATVPGVDFDPRERAFAAEELKPQPIIRKRPKLFVPEDNKDDKYWDRRSKNNFAARRSREARRLKENQIALRAAFLEKENNVLKRELDDANFQNSKLVMERDILKKKLAKYEN